MAGREKTCCYAGTESQMTVTMVSWSSLSIGKQGAGAHHFQIPEGVCVCGNADTGHHSSAKSEEEG